ncbi:MAG: hypothetical protein KAR07_12135, partial [Spirochaetes bacterium]|nr:hypothetical protein [Spirochaetota bacterium]
LQQKNEKKCNPLKWSIFRLQEFLALIQNRFYWAITGKKGAEILYNSAKRHQNIILSINV